MDPSKASETLQEQNPLSLSNKVPDWGTSLEDSLGEQAVLSAHTQHYKCQLCHTGVSWSHWAVPPCFYKYLLPFQPCHFCGKEAQHQIVLFFLQGGLASLPLCRDCTGARSNLAIAELGGECIHPLDQQ